MRRASRGIFTTFLLAIFLWLFPAPSHALAVYSAFTVGSSIYQVNGSPKAMDAVPFVKAGRVYIPLRYAAASLGIPESGISYTNGIVSLRTGTTSATIVVGDSIMLVNGKPVRMDAVPCIVKGRTFLPIRYIAEACECQVAWDQTTRTVRLSTQGSTIVSASNNNNTIQVSYKWSYRGISYSLGPYSYGTAIKTYYWQKDHPTLRMNMRTGVNNFQSFVDNYTIGQDYNGILHSLAASLQRAAERDGHNKDMESFIIAFVQGLPYVNDSVTNGDDDYAKYPVETLYDKGGDCEDTCILAAALLRDLGYGCALLIYPGTAEDPGHMALGVLDDGTMSGSYYEQNGKRYYYMEMTGSGWQIGDVPPMYKNYDTYVVPVK